MFNRLSSSSVDVLDGALRAGSTPTHTRRWLLERAAVGTAGVTVAGAVIPTANAIGASSDESIQDFGVFASTTEALTVTLLTELLRRVSLHREVPSGVVAVFDGAYAAELDHWRFISKFFRPSTKRFWIPDGVFGGAGNDLALASVGAALVAGETLVNTYLIGVTTFAAAGRSTLARYSAELAGVEAEHRVLAQTLVGANPPNNLGFEAFKFERVSAIKAALEGVGFGFGQQGQRRVASTSSRIRPWHRRSRSCPTSPNERVRKARPRLISDSSPWRWQRDPGQLRRARCGRGGGFRLVLRRTLGIADHDAHPWGPSQKGYWRVTGS